MALNHARATIAGWDQQGFILSASTALTVPGHYVFGFGLPPDASGRPVRLGGNWPLLVDMETGECRQVAGVSEYTKLRRMQERDAE